MSLIKLNTTLISKKIDQLKSILSNEKEEINCIKIKKKEFKYLKKYAPFYNIWIALFLPSKLDILTKYKKDIIKKIDKNIFKLKVDTLKINYDEDEVKELQDNINPFDSLNENYYLMILENIIKLRNEKIPKSLIIKRKNFCIAIANRFGLWKLRYLLEDTIFFILKPKTYRMIESFLLESEKIHRKLFKNIINVIEYHFKKINLKYFEIKYRKKNIYGVYEKMEMKHDSINKINDIFGIRIIVKTVSDCYKVLKLLHLLWPHYENRLKDYIKNPKPNQYQSLHTTLFCIEKKPVEFQIRTIDMHYVDKFGSARYDLYKEKHQLKL